MMSDQLTVAALYKREMHTSCYTSLTTSANKYPRGAAVLQPP